MRKQTVMVAIAAVLVLAPSLFANSDQKKNEEKSAPAAAQQTTATAAAANTGYVIGPEDVLKINIWKEPEMSGDVPVRPDGKISLTLLGDVQAAGLTPTQLTTQITDLLKKYLDDPRVTVTVGAVNSRRVFILGQVGRPGAFPLLPDMTVLQALSTAGGLSLYAATDKIYVLRIENGNQVKLAFQYKQVIKGNKPEQNIVLKSGDTIVVP
jgi:polysaccharide export outer membrane protein